jgi:hypothetical protein
MVMNIVRSRGTFFTDVQETDDDCSFSYYRTVVGLLARGNNILKYIASSY